MAIKTTTLQNGDNQSSCVNGGVETQLGDVQATQEILHLGIIMPWLEQKKLLFFITGSRA